MLYPTKSMAERLERILQDSEAGRLSDQEAGEQLLAIDPESPTAYSLLASAKADAGDLEAAEALAWKALDRLPCHAGSYLFLADIRLTRYPGDPLARELKHFALWKLSFLEKIPRAVAGDFRKQLGKTAPGLDFSNPLTYEAIARTYGENAERSTDPEITDRLLPYRLLNDIERQAYSGLEDRLIEEIREHAGRCAPLLHAALRELAQSEGETSSTAACMVAALLGETGGPEYLIDLVEWSIRDDAAFRHGGWAAWRLARRFPGEAFATLRQAIPDADLPMRCAIAEHLVFLGEETDITPAMPELLESFEKFAAQIEACQLLAMVTAALREHGGGDLARTLVARYAGLLPAEGRDEFEWMQDTATEDLSLLSNEGVDLYDVEQVCRDGVLLEEEGPPAVKPGRNEPCWCGSGKKYKKCHLVEDEEDERRRRREEEEEEETEEDEEQSLPAGDREHMRLFAEVLDANSKNRSDLERPIRLYFGDEEMEESEQLPFFEWYLRDYRVPLTGRTPVEEYLLRPGLPPRDRQVLESWRDCRFGLYEIQRIEEGTGAEIKDLCAGDSFFVHNVATSRERVKGDCMLARVEELDGKRMFSEAGTQVPRPMADRLLEWIEAERTVEGQSASEFLRANGHRLHRVLEQMARDRFEDVRIANADGDPLA